MINWYFPLVPRNAAEVTQETSSLNSEEASINETLGRETVQNGRDARPDPNKNTPIRLRYSWVDFDNEDFFVKYLDKLVPHLKQMKRFDLEDNYQISPSFLVIEDFGTTGLTGPINPSEEELMEMEEKEEFSNFDNYTMQIGNSGKKGTQGGRRGTGRSCYNLASELSTQFVISNRADDKKSVFIGICMGNTHRIDVKRYKGIGYYCDFKQDSETPIWPLYEDKDDIQIFKEKLGLKRGDEPGTSVIIPYPIAQVERVKIISGLIESYFFLISKNLLEVEFNWAGNTEILNKDSLNNFINKYYFESYLETINFIDNCENQTIPQITLRDNAADDAKLNKEDFNDEDEIKELRRKFNSHQIVSIKVPVTIKKKETRNNIKSYFELFIQKVKQTNIQGKSFFIRNDMPLIDEGKNVSKSVFGYMRAMDNEMTTMLAHSENVNHVKLEPSHPDLKRYYKPGYNRIIRTIKNSLGDLTSLLLNIDDEDDITTFAGMLPFNEGEQVLPSNDVDTGADFNENEEDDDADDKGKDDKKVIPVPTDIPSNTSPAKIVKIQKSKGIRVKANTLKEGIDAYFPMKLQIRMSYSKQGKRKSLKSYHPFDFDFSSNESYLELVEKNIEILSKHKNVIEFKALDKDFNLDIKNLLTDIYDLEVDLQYV